MTSCFVELLILYSYRVPAGPPSHLIRPNNPRGAQSQNTWGFLWKGIFQPIWNNWSMRVPSVIGAWIGYKGNGSIACTVPRISARLAKHSTRMTTLTSLSSSNQTSTCWSSGESIRFFVSAWQGLNIYLMTQQKFHPPGWKPTNAHSQISRVQVVLRPRVYLLQIVALFGHTILPHPVFATLVILHLHSRTI